MKVIAPCVMLVSHTPNPLEVVEQAGRTAYKSEDKIAPGTAAPFVRSLIKRGHESVLEHASATLRFVCDRGVTHEMVRHRIASYTQESTRYCNYGASKHGGEIAVVRPPLAKVENLDIWCDAMRSAESAYLALLAHGESPQIARSVLPTCLKTEIVTTYNFREWRHFFKLRCASTAHPQMREVAWQALDIMLAIAPAAFDDLFTEGEA